jgi:hypothetical protein
LKIRAPGAASLFPVSMNEMTKTAKINGITAQGEFRDIQIAALQRLSSQKQSVENTGFPRTIWTEKQGQRPNGDNLRLSEGFEIAKT